MQKRLLRYLSALIASLICTYTGMRQQAAAQPRPACSLSDVSAWHALLNAPEEEATPTYVQAVTEDFLSRCPDRPETGAAHRIAGVAAAWAGEIDAAAAHFDRMGHVTETEALLMHAAVRFALGETARAADIRNIAIDSWVARLKRRGIADIETETTSHGEIIRVRFRETGPELRISHLWIARPAEAAWPATLSISSGRQLNAFHRLRAGSDAPRQNFVRLYRCTARKLLAQTPSLNDRDMNALAGLSLTAYMANPDKPAPGELNPCLFDGRLLPDVGGSNTIPVQ